MLWPSIQIGHVAGDFGAAFVISKSKPTIVFEKRKLINERDGISSENRNNC